MMCMKLQCIAYALKTHLVEFFNLSGIVEVTQIEQEEDISVTIHLVHHLTVS